MESLNQLELINSCAVECGIKVKVLIRVTSGNQFGINERQVYEIADRKDELKGIIIEGIQCYSGTQKKKLSQIEAEVVWLQAIAHTCEAEHGVKLKRLSMVLVCQLITLLQTNVMP
ncbi:MAG: alanine racemase [Lachnospira eligens]